MEAVTGRASWGTLRGEMTKAPEEGPPGPWRAEPEDRRVLGCCLDGGRLFSEEVTNAFEAQELNGAAQMKDWA